jgi:hypothetical protein
MLNKKRGRINQHRETEEAEGLFELNIEHSTSNIQRPIQLNVGCFRRGGLNVRRSMHRFKRPLLNVQRLRRGRRSAEGARTQLSTFSPFPMWSRGPISVLERSRGTLDDREARQTGKRLFCLNLMMYLQHKVPSSGSMPL